MSIWNEQFKLRTSEQASKILEEEEEEEEALL
jgi:hypothetical protein